MTALLSSWLWVLLWVGPLLLAGACVPVWPWSRRWGLLPAVGLVLLTALVLLLHACFIV